LIDNEEHYIGEKNILKILKGTMKKMKKKIGFSLIKKPLRSGHPRKRTRTPFSRSQTKKNLSKADTSSKNLH
jgi:hypothetical protein